jgi:hypothetical protein
MSNFGSFVAGALFGGLLVYTAQQVNENRRERLKKHFDDAIDKNVQYDAAAQNPDPDMPSFDEFVATMQKDAEAKKEFFKKASIDVKNMTNTNVSSNTGNTNAQENKKEEKIEIKETPAPAGI